MTELDTVLVMKVGETLTALGVSPGFLETRRLPMYADAERLALVEVDAAGRELLLTPPTVIARQSMSERATHDMVRLPDPVYMSAISQKRTWHITAMYVNSGDALK